jgi:hypothetical protein
MKRGVATLAVSLALGISACTDPPAAPDVPEVARLAPQAQRVDGTGLVLESLTDVSLPIVGSVDRLVIDQVVINDLMLVEDLTGAIIGLEVTGTVNGVVGVLGTPVVDQKFTSSFGITSSGPGQCDLVTIDLGPLNIDALDIVTGDVDPVELTGRGSGAVGSLLCNLGQALSGVVGGVTRGVQGLVNAINRLI